MPGHASMRDSTTGMRGRRDIGDVRAYGDKGAYDPGMSSRRHDRHGRAKRADNNRRRRPPDGFRATHGARFSDLVENAISELPPALLQGVSGVEIVIEAVPPLDSAAIAKGAVPLARLLEHRGESGGTSPVTEGRRLVVYRRPLELRSSSRSELVEVIRIAIGMEVARFMGIEDVDGLFDDGDW